MERRVDDRNVLDRFCRNFCSIVSRHCEYIIVSGYLVIATGRTRGTEDIGMIVPKLPLGRFIELHDDLLSGGFTCMQSDDPKVVFEYLADSTSVRYTYKDRPLPEMELKFARDELDDYQLKTRQRIPLTGLDVFFSSVDMNIAFKEEYLKSDKDMEDARHLRLIFSESIDEKEILRIKALIRRLRL